MNQGLSTELAPAYKIKREPTNFKLEIGKSYLIENGNGRRNVTIVSMRKIEDDILIYYKYKVDRGNFFERLFTPVTGSGQTTLQTFKAQLLDYGKVESIDLIYPVDKPTENYYPIKEE